MFLILILILAGVIVIEAKDFVGKKITHRKYLEIDASGIKQTAVTKMFIESPERISAELGNEHLQAALGKLDIKETDGEIVSKIISVQGDVSCLIYSNEGKPAQFVYDREKEAEVLLLQLQEQRIPEIKKFLKDLSFRMPKYYSDNSNAENLYQICRDYKDVVETIVNGHLKKVSCLDTICCAAEAVESGKIWLNLGDSEVSVEGKKKTVPETDIFYEEGKVRLELYNKLVEEGDACDAEAYGLAILFSSYSTFFWLSKKEPENGKDQLMANYYMGEALEKLVYELRERCTDEDEEAEKTIENLKEKYSQHYMKANEYSEKNDGTFRIEKGVLERLHSLVN